MAGDNWIYSYYQGISNGTYTVGKWIRLVYEYIIDGLERKAFFFDQKKANDAIEWIEKHCFHTEGPLAPAPLRLEVWQKAFFSAVFGLVDENGVRQFREFLLVIGRKNGKTKIASSAAEYIFQHEGGYGTRVFCIAPKLEQADLVYNDVWQMITLDPEWQALKKKSQEKDTQHRKVHDDSMLARHRQTDLSIPGTNSTVKKIAFSARKSDGFNPSLCICDEVASWQGDQGLKQYEVMKSGMGARADAIMLSCTTAGYVDGGIYDELLARSTRFLLGNSKEKKLLPFLYIVDDVEKWNDINELRKSNPNLGVSVQVDFMLDEIAVAEGSLSRRTEFIAKHCCIKQHSSLAWLPAVEVERAAADPLPDLKDFENCYCIGGIDLSRTTDLTACTAVIQKDGQLYVYARFFLPGARLEEAMARDGLPYDAYVKRGILKLSGENFVDYHDCFDFFRELVEKYRVFPIQVGYDRYSAQYLVKDMEAYGFQMDDVFQGFNLTPCLNEFDGLLRDGKIHIGDNDLLKIHLLNAALKHDTQTERIRLVKIKATDHIDGCAALIDAITVRQKHWAEIGGRLENSGR